MLYVVLSLFVLACFAPLLHRYTGRHSGNLLALVPAILFIFFFSQLSLISQGEVLRQSWAWFPGMNIQLSFLLDGLSLLFALLITGIGTFILLYANSYLQGHPALGRFFLFLLTFMGAMLGLVLADNLIALFVFWELTTVSSFMLIGFNHEDAESRQKAHQGLMVTVIGGLALMTGFIMLGFAGGTYELSVILQQDLTEHALYAPMLILILLGAFTKSAQTPFHFWLPNAMAAPTPVSAYLHSATMVKAGIYLLARLHPSLSDSALWMLTLSAVGAVTMVTGIILASRATGVKKVLAYSTVMALGTLTMLLGLGTEKAALAAVTFLLAHALYKGALFMIAGILDHEAGVKDFEKASGLRHKMPKTCAVAIVAALSLAGVIPLFGFVAKELLLEAVLSGAHWQVPLIIATVVANIFVVLVAALLAIKPWFGEVIATPKHAHDPGLAMLVGPTVLATLSLVLGIFPFIADKGLLQAAATAVHGSPVTTYLALWHGFNLPLLLSVISLTAGLVLYSQWTRWRKLTSGLEKLMPVGPEALYTKMMAGLVLFAAWQTKVLQNGYLRNYLLTTIATMLFLVGWAMFRLDNFNISLDLHDVKIQEAAVFLILLVTIFCAVIVKSLLASVALLGALGFAVALIYVFFSAVDVGITQVLVETITVLLLVLVLYRLPEFRQLSSNLNRARDAFIAISSGVMITLLILLITNTRSMEGISHYFIANSVPEGFGRNIVNVILVDFRALDTLGEIFVLALVAIGIYAMVHLRTGAKPITNADKRIANELKRVSSAQGDKK
ncbi:putative monovalent cation/H+ antiporter subunit A [Alishewanella sp. d11]|uniref:putative monovalent cation/H+ antiporter subunit A n=1 Tax=Alishewanella sp. d11 TaxID=3414030 RepID=UPI003BF86E9D